MNSAGAEIISIVPINKEKEAKRQEIRDGKLAPFMLIHQAFLRSMGFFNGESMNESLIYS
ncbi:hypothetical protein CVN76_17125 [Bacillus sp. mrc49]|nr:hypothetical protein CVN76_17125 [Bacillus sp. mrc49]